MDDLFAPPTEEELSLNSDSVDSESLFAPPSSDELLLANASADDSISASKAATIGAAEGLTLGAYQKMFPLVAASVASIPGVTPDLPRESSLDKFERLRKLAEQTAVEERTAAQEQQPVASFAGELGGGLLLGGGGAAQFIKGGAKQAAKAALKKGLGKEAAKKAATTAGLIRTSQVGAGLGALASAARTEDLASQEGIMDVGAGAITGGVLPVTLWGVSKLPHLIPQKTRVSLATAFKEGLEGRAPLSDDAEKIVTSEINEVIDTIRSKVTPAYEKQKSMVEGAAYKAGKIVKSAQDAVNKKLNSLADSAEKSLDILKKQQVTDNEIVKKKLQVDAIKLADKFRNQLQETRSALSKEYSTIDDSSKNLGVRVFSTDIIGDLEQKLQDKNLELPKGVTKHLGDLDFGQFQVLKRELADLMKPSASRDPNFRVYASEAYHKLNKAYEDSLEAAGAADLANKLRDVNSKWASTIKLEDYLGDVGARAGAEAQITAQKTIKDLAVPTSEKMTLAKEFQDIQKNIIPEEQSLIPEAQKLSEDILQANKFKPSIPEVSDVLKKIPSFEEMTSAKEALKRASNVSKIPQQEVDSVYNTISEAVGPAAANEFAELMGKMQQTEVLNTLSKFAKDPNASIDKIRSIVVSYGDKFDSSKLSSETQELVGILSNAVGKKEAARIVREMDKVSKRWQLGRLLQGRESPEGASQSTFITSLLGGILSSSAKMSLKAGQAVGAVKMTPDKISAAIKKATPEQLRLSADILSAYGTKEAKAAADLLSKGAKPAALFMIMRNPTMRDMVGSVLNDINPFTSDEGDNE